MSGARGPCVFWSRWLTAGCHVLCSVKEMDPGQIGLLIKVLNIGAGLALAVWAGVFMVLEIVSYLNCDDTTIDGSCCPNPVEGAIVCPSHMTFWSNLPALIISFYMIPLGSILILYEISTRRVGAQEVCDPVAVCPAALATVQHGFRRRVTYTRMVIGWCSPRSRSPSQPVSGPSWLRFGKA